MLAMLLTHYNADGSLVGTVTPTTPAGFIDAAKQFGRQPIELVDIDTDHCALSFGVGACNATGEPCYNTWPTCKAKPAYADSIKTYHFAANNAVLPVGFSCIPVVAGVAYAPQVLTPAKGLGVRGSVTVRFNDTDWPDTADDPYYNQRPTGTEGRGTFWGRWRARHKYYVGRMMHIKTGYLIDGALSDDYFERRSYVIESITGPDKSGIVTVTGKDVLKLADDARAQCPRATTARLDKDITESASTFIAYPSGIGDLEFSASGVLRIASEVMTYTRSADTFTVQRGQFGTVAKAAKADDAIQACAQFINQPVQNLIYSLLVDFAKIPAAYINKPVWDVERDNHLQGVYSSLITDPVGVNTLIGELSEQGQCYIWWDETAQQIRFKALTAPPQDLPVLNDDDHFLMGSLNAGESVNDRQSRFIIRFDRIDPTKKLDEVANYRQRHLSPDLQSEGEHEHGSSRTRIINSRWFNTGSLGRVQQLGAALLSRYRDPPRTLEFSVDQSAQIKTGDIFNVQSRVIQTASGAKDVIAMQAVEVRYSKAATTLQVKASELVWTGNDVPVDPLILIGADIADVNLRDIYIAEYGQPRLGQNITFVVETDVLVYGSFAAGYAILTGEWPENVNITLINKGFIVGAGGKGGRFVGTSGPGVEGSDALNGENGSNAIGISYPITIINNKTIAGGGGGGGAFFMGGGGGASYGKGGKGAPDNSPTDGQNGGRLVGGQSYEYTGSAQSSLGAWTRFGGSGGNIGQKGQDMQNPPEYDQFTGKGGSAGFAIIDPDGLATIINNGQILGS